MGTKYEIKRVNFMGDELVAVRENDSNKIYVGVNWVCRGLGLDERFQRDKIMKHEVLNEGCCLNSIPTESGVQEAYVMDIETLPSWLITITPSRVKLGAREKLVEYQRKAKKVLADAFAPRFGQQVHTYSIPEDLPKALRLAANLAEKVQVLEPKAEQYDKFMESKGNQTVGNVAKSLGTGRGRLFRFLREQRLLMKKNIPYQRFISQGLFATKQKVVYNSIRGAFNYTQTLVTPKGIDYISKLL